jgi:hypothetical protein
MIEREIVIAAFALKASEFTSCAMATPRRSQKTKVSEGPLNGASAGKIEKMNIEKNCKVRSLACASEQEGFRQKRHEPQGHIVQQTVKAPHLSNVVCI